MANHDYARPCVYLVTICTANRARCLGTVTRGVTRLSLVGEIVRDEWLRTAYLRCSVRLLAEELVVMPNHVHGIVRIVEARDALATVVGAFKAAVSRRIASLPGEWPRPLWQRGYHERILLDSVALGRAQDYIRNNPAAWSLAARRPD